MNKILIWTRFSRMAKILHRELDKYNPAIITGDIKDRQAEVDKFNNDDSCRIIIGTLAMSEGLNLQRGNILIFFDVPMGSYGTYQQAVGRIHRIGQDKSMVVYHLLGEIDGKPTIDQKLRDLLLKKKDMSEKIFGSLLDVRKVLE